MRRALAALAAALLAGCPSDDVGTIQLGITTAPSSPVMDAVAQLRLTFLVGATTARPLATIDRTDRGFDLSLDLDATGEAGTLVVEGFDAAGALVATGASPPFPISAIDARIAIYMAPPMSVALAPVALAPARAKSSATALGYGAAIAGGVDAAGAPVTAIQVYNAFDHSLVSGLPLPAARTAALAALASNNGVYLFGGTDAAGAATGTLWHFDTTVAPSGRFTELGDFPQFARSGGTAIALGDGRFLLPGAPALQLQGNMLAEPAGIPPLASGASVTAGGAAVAILVETTGALHRLRGTTVEPLGASRKGAVATPIAAGKVALLGGEATPADAFIVDAASGEGTAIPGALAAAYTSIAAAATPRFVVVAGATSSTETGIDVLDATTLERRYTTAIPDAISAAIALPNEQVLLVGSALHLFTPPPAER